MYPCCERSDNCLSSQDEHEDPTKTVIREAERSFIAVKSEISIADISVDPILPHGRMFLRTQRSKGRKELRCFPECNPCGHTSSEKCGGGMSGTFTLSLMGRVSSIAAQILETAAVVVQISPDGVLPQLRMDGDSVPLRYENGEPVLALGPEFSSFTFRMEPISGMSSTYVNDATHIKFAFDIKQGTKWFYDAPTNRWEFDKPHELHLSLVVMQGGSLRCLGYKHAGSFFLRSARRYPPLHTPMQSNSSDRKRSKRRRSEHKRCRKVSPVEFKVQLLAQRPSSPIGVDEVRDPFYNNCEEDERLCTSGIPGYRCTSPFEQLCHTLAAESPASLCCCTESPSSFMDGMADINFDDLDELLSIDTLS